MKKTLLILLLLVSTSLYAKESGYTLSAAFTGMSMDYREYNSAGLILDSEKSSFDEIIGSEFIFDYTRVYSNDNYAQVGVETLFLRGNTEYVGSLINDPNCKTYGCYNSTTQNDVFDIAAYYMYTHAFNNGLNFGYGLSLGYRSWTRILSSIQTEVYYWYSVRPRAQLTYDFLGLSVGTLVEYQYGINPKMSATGFSSDFELGSANIVKVKIPIKYDINEKIGIFVEYVYEQQIIEKSNVQSGFIEPDSTANNQYAKIGATFKF